MEAMTAFTIALGAVQGFAAIQQGKAQKAMYQLQAKQAELQGRRQALNYSNQAIQVMDRQRKMSATLIASSASAGVNPFTGSPMTVDEANAMEAGKEYNRGIENADMAIAGGLAQSQSLQSAGNQAMKSAYLSAVMSVGSSIMSAGSISTPGGSSLAPVIRPAPTRS